MMIANDDGRRPKFLVPDSSPLSLLGTIPRALDWLFVPKCEVWIPDIILDEVLRNPGEGRDQRIQHRAEIADWVKRNRSQIKRLTTRIGERYAKETKEYENAREMWQMVGRPIGREPQRPDWQDRGDESVWVAVRTANASLPSLGDCVIVLTDDGEVRDAIRIKGRRLSRASINLMGTQSFIEWMVTDFGIKEASTAWQTIARARENQVPTMRTARPDEDARVDDIGPDDPVLIRVP